MRYFLFICSVFFTLVSCTKDSDPLFEMELQADFIIQPGLNNFETHFFIVRNVPTFISSYLSNHGNTFPDQILASRAVLTGRFSEIDFGIVQSVSIWAISSMDQNLRKEIFYHEFVPFNHDGELQLFSSLPNLTDILLQEQFDLEIRLIFKTFTPNEMDSRLFMTFNAYVEE